MTQTNKSLGYICAAYALVLFGVHTFVGGAEVAVPLAQMDIPLPVQAPALMVWHMMTGILALNAALFTYATLRSAKDIMVVASALTAVIAVTGLISIWLTGASFSELPQGAAFAPLAVLGFIASRKL